jgi:hypothetical protein
MMVVGAFSTLFALSASLGLSVGGTFALPAATKNKGMVLLVQEPSGSYATAIRRVVEADAKGSFVAPPGLPLPEVVLALGCNGFDAACAAQIADTLDAGAALVVAIDDDPTAVVATMRLVGKGGKLLRPPAAFRIPGNNPRRPLRDRFDRVGYALGQAASAYARKLPLPAILWVEGTDSSSSVVIDGQRTEALPANVVDLPAGSHTLEVQSTTTMVDLVGGEVVIAYVQGPAAVAAPDQKAIVGTTRTSPGWAWPVFGVGVAAAVVGGAVGITHNVLVLTAYGPKSATGDTFKSNAPMCAGPYSCGDRSLDSLTTQFNLVQAVAAVSYVVGGIGIITAATGMWATTWEE